MTLLSAHVYMHHRCVTFLSFYRMPVEAPLTRRRSGSSLARERDASRDSAPALQRGGRGGGKSAWRVRTRVEKGRPSRKSVLAFTRQVASPPIPRRRLRRALVRGESAYFLR